ncbi:Ribonuclease H-like protein [Theobroma cacao]|uniref:Ribonuclease H-like protein n=1 Tax=Theobroma cacao TaxID=3641 RepID=A0A061GBP5_THECC|nr:Ribonuclease H-like protein [Theobroma cacao]
MQKCLLTNKECVMRHLSSNSCNMQCRQEDETIPHTLRDYPLASALSLRLVPQKYQALFFSASLTDWLSHNLSHCKLTVREIQWVTIFGTSCWNGIEALKSRKEEILVDWTASPHGWFTLNSDGAFRRSLGKAVTSGVLRDSCGNWFGGFSATFGTCTAYRAELWGTYKGLNLAW